MALEVFPTTPKPAYSYILEHEFRTSVITMESGIEQRNRRWRFPRRTVMLVYRVIPVSTSGGDALRDFFYDRFGGYESFWYFDLQSRKWLDQYVGKGDGATKTFDLPGSNTVISSLYVNGTATAAYTTSAGTGEGGADQITFTSAPAVGSLITVDFTSANLRIKGTLKDDKYSEELIFKDHENVSISIYEVKSS